MKDFYQLGDYEAVVDDKKTSLSIFVFIGPPGSGKGTLASRCEQEKGVPVLSTGNLCRWHIQHKTALGNELAQRIDKGELIPDKLMTTMVTEWIQEHAEGRSACILDGFPRTVAQAKLLQEFVASGTVDAYVVPIFFEISPKVLLDRLLQRQICGNKSCQVPYSPTKKPKLAGQCDLCNALLIRRNDDTKEVIEHRLAVYQEHAQDLLPFLQDQFFEGKCKKMHFIDSEKLSIDELYHAFCALLP